MSKLLEFYQKCDNLNQIVEGFQGAMEHGTWRDEKGRRLKDTKEWAEFYVAMKVLLHSETSPPKPSTGADNE